MGIRWFMNRVLVVAVWVAVLQGAWTKGPLPESKESISGEVRHVLTVLPYYKVFDYLNFRVNGDTVTLLGQVTGGDLKAAAADAVGRIAGVRSVDNQIEVLPQSPSDEKVRLGVYVATYGQLVFNQYATRAIAPVHIVVKNGNVTLEGTVDDQEDKTWFFTEASGVTGVVSVTDHLKTVASAPDQSMQRLQ